MLHLFLNFFSPPPLFFCTASPIPPVNLHTIGPVFPVIFIPLNRTVMWLFSPRTFHPDEDASVSAYIGMCPQHHGRAGTVEAEPGRSAAPLSGGVLEISSLGPGSWAHLSLRCSDREEVLGASRRTICSSTEVACASLDL